MSEHLKDPELDIVFVIEENSLGWILEARCRHVRQYLHGTSAIHYSCSNLPAAKAYFFAHYSFLPLALAKNPGIWKRKLIAWYTHPSDIGVPDSALIFALNKTTKVLFTCVQFKELIVAAGLAKEKAEVAGPCADENFFRTHERGKGLIGLCSRYYPRKSPGLILQCVQKMPHRDFLLLGSDWHKFENFEKLKSLPNFRYVEAPYEDYPTYYGQMDVFLSASKLEGGPVPLIEAMMSNVVPVASRTGFAPDIIEHGKNGFLFNLDDPVENTCALLDSAFSISTNIRQTVEHLTWKNYAARLEEILGADPGPRSAQKERFISAAVNSNANNKRPT